jgi:hypothetical protein
VHEDEAVIGLPGFGVDQHPIKLLVEYIGGLNMFHPEGRELLKRHSCILGVVL